MNHSDSTSAVRTEQRSITVSREMVQEFAALTGDSSSLHTDPDFGRRSAYRRNVAHGMLPLLFLSTFQFVRPDETVPVLRRLAARFVKPIFAGDTIVLKASVDEETETECHVSFQLSHPETSAIYTTGSITVVTGVVEEDSGADEHDLIEAPGSLVVGELAESTYLFTEVERGQTAGFEFKVTPGHVRDLHDLLRKGIGDDLEADVGTRTAVPWLSAALLSPLVGMCLPGRYATFMDFQLAFDETPTLNATHRLEGNVRYASDATETLVQQVTVRPSAPNGARVASGKVSVKVNTPQVHMPTMSTLRDEAVDLGLQEKVVLITGASRGIGETTAKLFALHGARVVVNYLASTGDADRVVGEIREKGGEARAIQADVTDRESVRRMVAEVDEVFGGLDVLVNNAVRDFSPVRFLDLTWNEIQKDLDVVVAGAVYCCQAVIPMMIERGGGHIVNLSTLAVEAPPEGQSKYVMAKSALVGLTRSLAREFSAHGIRVNAVVPSMVETDLTQHVSKIFKKGAANDTPLGRNASPVDVAKAIVFLASSWSSFTTGQKLMVTGGQLPFL